MTYDAAFNGMLLFGGLEVTGTSSGTWTRKNDLWLWKNGNWTEIVSQCDFCTDRPSPRLWAGFSRWANGISDEHVLFGGCTSLDSDQRCNGFSQETWFFDHATNIWYQQCSSPCIPPRARMVQSQIAQDAFGSAVMFGGYSSGNTYLNDTWKWNGTTWECLVRGNGGHAGACQAETSSVATRSGGGMAKVYCNPCSGETGWRVLLYGGGNNANALFSDTWLWNENSNTWTQFTGGSNPGARQSFGIARHPGDGKVVLMGGVGNGGAFIAKRDTWLFSGA